MKGKAIVAGLAIAAAACTAQFLQKSPLEDPSYKPSDYSADLMPEPDFLTYEAYFPPEMFEPDPLEKRLGFKNEGGTLIKLLGEGTGHEVPAYFLKGRVDGPTALIVAPHGDEIGAWRAAQQLASYTVDKGNLVVIPWLDTIAVRQNARYNYIDGADPNRDFGARKSGTYVSKIADDIKDLLGTGKIDLVLNLHEAFGYHSKNRDHLGQSIIVDTPELAEKAVDLLAAVNEGLQGKEKFDVLLLQSEPTLTYYCTFVNQPRVPAYGIETSKDMDNGRSREIHLRSVRIFLDRYGINLKKAYFAASR